MSARPLAESAPLLRVESLRKAFGGVRAVDDVSFELGAGELLSARFGWSMVARTDIIVMALLVSAGVGIVFGIYFE